MAGREINRSWCSRVLSPSNNVALMLLAKDKLDARLIFSPRTNQHLHFPVVPVCQHGQTKVFGVARQETARIPCELEANPSEVSFTWKFNNTMEAVDIAQAHVTSDRTRSTASYTPMTELDYGTLLCWGSNDQGTQLEPCVYHIVPAGKCSPLLKNCFRSGPHTSLAMSSRCASLLLAMIDLLRNICD